MIVNCELPSKNGGLVLYNKDKRVIILMIVHIYIFIHAVHIGGCIPIPFPPFFIPLVGIGGVLNRTESQAKLMTYWSIGDFQ